MALGGVRTKTSAQSKAEIEIESNNPTSPGERMRVLIFLDFEKAKTLGRPAPLGLWSRNLWEMHTPNPAVCGSHITEHTRKGFPGGPVVKSPPSNTGT